MSHHVEKQCFTDLSASTFRACFSLCVLCCTCHHNQQWGPRVLEYICTTLQRGEKLKRCRSEKHKISSLNIMISFPVHPLETVSHDVVSSYGITFVSFCDHMMWFKSMCLEISFKIIRLKRELFLQQWNFIKSAGRPSLCSTVWTSTHSGTDIIIILPVALLASWVNLQ